MTSLDSWTDYELRHEFDSPVVTPTEYLTRANLGEVVPKAGCPLTNSTTSRLVDFGFLANWKSMMGSIVETNSWTYGRALATWENHGFLNVLNCLHRLVETEIKDRHRAADMAIFGHM